jgi:hypothetical protein
MTALVDGVTLKLTPLLATPPTVTTTFPVVASGGTGATMLAALQLVGVVTVPLNVTVPAVPKLVPVMVTEVPTGPEVGRSVVILGFCLLWASAFAWFCAWRGTLSSEANTTMKKGKRRFMGASRKHLTSCHGSFVTGHGAERILIARHSEISRTSARLVNLSLTVTV